MSFKICMAGCGYMAVEGHGPAYREYARSHPDTELVACCDKDEEKAVSFRKKFGFSRHYTDIDKMLDAEKPDAMCLVVPVNLTCPLSLRILERGIPLLLEKPPGLDRDETLEMMRAAERNKVPNQVAFNRRYMPLVKRLKQLLVETGAGGDMNLNYRMLRVRRTDPDFSTTAIHGIDVVRHLAGSNYSRVRLRYQELEKMGKGVANIFLDCEFESGAAASLSFCPVSGTVVERVEVNSCGHTFFANFPIGGSVDLPGRLLHNADGKTVLDIDGNTLSGCGDGFVLAGFHDENESFFEDIRMGRKPEGDIASGLQAVELADCIRKRLPEYSHSR